MFIVKFIVFKFMLIIFMFIQDEVEVELILIVYMFIFNELSFTVDLQWIIY